MCSPTEERGGSGRNRRRGGGGRLWCSAGRPSGGAGVGARLALGRAPPDALLLLGAELEASLARTPRIAGGGRADSSGVVSGADCAWAQMGSAGGFGAGPAGWVAGRGLRT
jgi:hypothetical protein